ncbi:hypothetical protein Egran_07147 [Elaphomyces granulatus]|uniref:Uncharacterized protein n=1 Tax=Elaphomyces granulatus TaxID=519963 RepID=A0A232LLP7_9EURO|nr:hypothetical protein Egran_07147 [Elaphomyces granulatus]
MVAGWEWEQGDWDNSVRFAPDDTQPPGLLTWVEDLDAYKDERGNGAHSETTQTVTDFLNTGPRERAPVAIIEAVLAHLQVQTPVWIGSYRLQQAVTHCKLEEVKALLAQGVESDMPVRGMTPLFCAVTAKDLPIAEALFDAGVDVNRRYSGMDETILMTLATYAPDTSWEPLAQRILAQGAELEARNRYGETPLMIAASSGYRLPGLVGILVAAGADVNARSVHGYTALWKAVSYRTAPLPIVQLLIAAGADVNACDKEGWSVLIEAISSCQVEAVRCLLEAGADVRAVTTPTQQYQVPKTVMQMALDYADPQIIQLIREAGGEDA